MNSILATPQGIHKLSALMLQIGSDHQEGPEFQEAFLHLQFFLRQFNGKDDLSSLKTYIAQAGLNETHPIMMALLSQAESEQKISREQHALEEARLLLTCTGPNFEIEKILDILKDVKVTDVNLDFWMEMIILAARPLEDARQSEQLKAPARTLSNKLIQQIPEELRKNARLLGLAMRSGSISSVKSLLESQSKEGPDFSEEFVNHLFKHNQSEELLKIISESGWIDKLTRIVFIEVIYAVPEEFEARFNDLKRVMNGQKAHQITALNEILKNYNNPIDVSRKNRLQQFITGAYHLHDPERQIEFNPNMTDAAVPTYASSSNRLWRWDLRRFWIENTYCYPVKTQVLFPLHFP